MRSSAFEGVVSPGLLLEVEDLVVHFPAEPRPIRAVDGVSLAIAEGETLALVGESGCGKSTIARAIMGLLSPTSGRIAFGGVTLPALGDPRRRPFLPKLQMVFQDPDASLNPRLTVAASVGEPLDISRNHTGPGARAARVAELLSNVGLPEATSSRYPHELSGGQKQRVCLARALATEPRLLVCDEAVSALDVSIQAQILNLLGDLQDRLGIAYLFITHDLRVVRHLSTRVAVMYLGQIVEVGDTDAIFEMPEHPYTRALLAALPSLETAHPAPAARVRGEIPSPSAPPSGCRFHTRCPLVFERCAREAPPLVLTRRGVKSRCFLTER
ncbi:MAG TPA: ABC transporter ATP-binding protein [Polyangiaceae bacterium]